MWLLMKSPVRVSLQSREAGSYGHRHSTRRADQVINIRVRRMSPELAQPVWKLKIPKFDENDILVFDLEIEWACNPSTSNGPE